MLDNELRENVNLELKVNKANVRITFVYMVIKNNFVYHSWEILEYVKNVTSIIINKWYYKMYSFI